MFFGKSYWKSQEQGIQREWLLTNGIGGFSSGTIIGMNARRYHGLLIASLEPPVERYLVLSGISEYIQLSEEITEKITAGSEAKKTVALKTKGNFNPLQEITSAANMANHPETTENIMERECTIEEEHYLHTFRTPNFEAHGEHYLEAFYYEYIPEFHYRIGSMAITKRISMRYGKNQVAIVYKIKNQPGKKAVFRLTPLVNFRNYHYLSSHPYMTFTTELSGRTMEITPYDDNRRIILGCSEGETILKPSCFFYNMDYPYEHERGLNGTEDHYIPGYFEINLIPGEEKTVTLVCSMDEPLDTLDGESLIDEEISRQKALCEKMISPEEGTNDDPLLKQLILASDKFIVNRKSTNAKTIIAGYPWFTDWGRDTMIAMPGLTLATKRFADAQDILITFAQYEKDGLIPNVFPDGTGEPAYNTVDAALWYFEAVYMYIQYTNDIGFVKDQLLPVLERIIQGYKNGTDFQIKMDKDALISAGNEETQLTWMDAKAGNWVVTPRHGKAVEINALWYNALMVMSFISEKTGGDASVYQKLAARVKDAFIKTFWNTRDNCLYDVVNELGPDAKIRPNQILAVGLSFPVLEGEHAKSVVDRVYELLYTALGLRTLNQKDPQYRGIYIGDQYARDGAYHQGTVWTWPLGRFISAYARVYRNDPGLQKQLDAFFLPFQDHLRDACVGNISEIFDGNEPLVPRGCFAQAWSVSEILRAYTER